MSMWRADGGLKTGIHTTTALCRHLQRMSESTEVSKSGTLQKLSIGPPQAWKAEQLERGRIGQVQRGERLLVEQDTSDRN